MGAGPYTTEHLEADDPRIVARTPGVRDVVRLFPAPASVGKGHLGIEGGLTVVGGPGMGKTTLLHQLRRALESERGIPVALVTLPRAGTGEEEQAFHRCLGDLVRQVRLQLESSASTPAEIRRAFEVEPALRGGGQPLSPRELECWVRELARAAAQSTGVALLFDELDRVARAPWRVAFVAALRFVFQAAAGITPVYAAWQLYLDEALPGSNYFRNVTRPLFLEPLSAEARGALFDLGLRGLPEAARRRVTALAGGHPRLLQRVLADLVELLDGRDAAGLGAEEVDALLARGSTALQRAIAAEAAAAPSLPSTLQALAAGRYPYRTLAKTLVASGLVDEGEDGIAVVPERVLSACPSARPAP